MSINSHGTPPDLLLLLAEDSNPSLSQGYKNTDKAHAYRSALTELKAEGKCPPDTVHRQVKYLNNIIEADHGQLKRLINRYEALNR